VADTVRLCARAAGQDQGVRRGYDTSRAQITGIRVNGDSRCLSRRCVCSPIGHYGGVLDRVRADDLAADVIAELTREFSKATVLG
jgi:hypothetical protein